MWSNPGEVMQTVNTVEGHEAQVLDQGDLLTLEREIRSWIMRIVWALLGAAVIVGASYADVRSQATSNARRIEEIRVEGSLPVQLLKQDIAVIRAELAANADRQTAIMQVLERLERRGR